MIYDINQYDINQYEPPIQHDMLQDSLHYYLYNNISNIKHLYFIITLQHSNAYYLIEHLIAQLQFNTSDEHIENIIYINNITLDLFENTFNDNTLLNSMFHNMILDKRLIKNINQIHNCNYIIFNISDTTLIDINNFISIINTLNIPFTKIYALRDIVSIFVSRLDYVLSKIYYENLNRMFVDDKLSIYHKSIIKQINTIKQFIKYDDIYDENIEFNDKILNIDYNIIYKKLLHLHKYFNKHIKQFKISDYTISLIINTIPTTNLINLYKSYIKDVGNNLLFDYNKYLTNNNYIHLFLSYILSKNKINISLINDINNIVPLFEYTTKIYYNYYQSFILYYNIHHNDTSTIKELLILLFKYRNISIIKKLACNDIKYLNILNYNSLEKEFITSINLCHSSQTLLNTQHNIIISSETQLFNKNMYTLTQINFFKQFSNTIKHAYIIFELRASGCEYFVQHLITQLPYASKYQNILYHLDASHYTLNSVINDFNLYYSHFLNPIIDERLITSYKQINNVEYMILVLNDKALKHINKFCDIFNACNIQYTKIFAIRDYINLLCSRINYSIDIITLNDYDYILHNTNSIHYKTILSYINKIKKATLSKSSINYDLIYTTLCNITEYYCKNFKFLLDNVLLDNLNRIAMMSVNDTMFNIYKSYLEYIEQYTQSKTSFFKSSYFKSDYITSGTLSTLSTFQTDSVLGLVFNYNEYLFNPLYITSLLESINIDVNINTYHTVKNFISHRYIIHMNNNIIFMIKLINKYKDIKIIKQLCNDTSIIYYNTFFEYTRHIYYKFLRENNININICNAT